MEGALDGQLRRLRSAPMHVRGDDINTARHSECAVTRLPLIHREPANDRERAQLHPETTDLEREAARVATEGVAPMPPNDAPVSPTGAAVIDGKGVALKIAAFVVLLAGAVAIKQPDLFPGTELDQHIAQIIVTIGTVIGIASPGLRKQG